MSSTLGISVSEENGVSVLRLNGSLDANTQNNLEEKADEVIQAGASNMVLDLDEVTYMGSAGLRALHIIAGKFGGADQSERFAHLKLLNPSAEVRRVLKTLGFDNYIDVFDNLDDAINSF
ncbi:STAS domain-containing protein [Pseudomonadota bacterium]